MTYKPTDSEVSAAAAVLYHFGRHHSWFPENLPESYSDMDPIGVQEFEALVDHMLVAAHRARSAETNGSSKASI